MQLQETEVVCGVLDAAVAPSHNCSCFKNATVPAPNLPSPAGLPAAALHTPHAAAAAVLLIAAAQPQCAPSYHHQAPDAAAQPANKHTNSTGQHNIIAIPAVLPYAAVYMRCSSDHTYNARGARGRQLTRIHTITSSQHGASCCCPARCPA
jgi:hypothetical protein